MTDFRFYVVSVSAILFALAAGVLLGSGPLRSALVDDLGGQVEQLRTELDQAALDLEVERQRASSQDQFLDAVSPWLLGERLEGRSVAIVTVFEPDPAAVGGLRAQLVGAGAAIVGVLEVGAAWTSDEQAAFRAALAEQMVESVETLPAGVPAREVLDAALLALLAPVQEEDAGAVSVIADILERAELVSGAVSGPPDVVIVIAGAGPEDSSQRVRHHDAMTATLTALAGAMPVVVASGPADAADLPSRITGDPASARVITTVTGGTSPEGMIAVVLAAAQAFEGGVGHYGTADALMPQP